jgi:hypothetical protein
MRAILPLLLLAACAGPARHETGLPLILEAAPTVRVLALSLEPDAAGLRLAGQLQLPGSVPSGCEALVQGLDASGTVLFEQAVELQLEPRTAARSSRRRASVAAGLPRPGALASVRLSIPGR